MSVDEGLELLFLRSMQTSSDENRQPATEIVVKLGGLALAIDQAGSYMASRCLPITKFMSHYRGRRQYILEYTSALWPYNTPSAPHKDARSVKLSAFTTWELSFLECGSTPEERTPYIEFLTAMACMNYNSVSQSVVETYSKSRLTQMPSFMCLFVSKDGVWDPYKYQDTIVHLLTISLVQSVDLKGDAIRFSLHPLIAEWLRLSSKPDCRRPLNTAINILQSTTKRYNDEEGGLCYESMAEISSHIRHCHDLDLELCRNGKEISDVLVAAAETFGPFLRHHDKFNDAEILLTGAMAGVRESEYKDQLKFSLGEV